MIGLFTESDSKISATVSNGKTFEWTQHASIHIEKLLLNLIG